jgi:DHA2 family multidrug resistance protein
LPTLGLKQLTALSWREAEVMTFNNLFQTISFIFLASLCVAAFLKKVDAKKAAAMPME